MSQTNLTPKLGSPQATSNDASKIDARGQSQSNASSSTQSIIVHHRHSFLANYSPGKPLCRSISSAEADYQSDEESYGPHKAFANDRLDGNASTGNNTTPTFGKNNAQFFPGSRTPSSSKGLNLSDIDSLDGNYFTQDNAKSALASGTNTLAQLFKSGKDYINSFNSQVLTEWMLPINIGDAEENDSRENSITPTPPELDQDAENAFFPDLNIDTPHDFGNSDNDLGFDAQNTIQDGSNRSDTEPSQIGLPDKVSMNESFLVLLAKRGLLPEHLEEQGLYYAPDKTIRNKDGNALDSKTGRFVPLPLAGTFEFRDGCYHPYNDEPEVETSAEDANTSPAAGSTNDVQSGNDPVPPRAATDREQADTIDTAETTDNSQGGTEPVPSEAVTDTENDNAATATNAPLDETEPAPLNTAVDPEQDDTADAAKPTDNPLDDTEPAPPKTAVDPEQTADAADAPDTTDTPQDDDDPVPPTATNDPKQTADTTDAAKPTSNPLDNTEPAPSNTVADTADAPDTTDAFAHEALMNNLQRLDTSDPVADLKKKNLRPNNKPTNRPFTKLDWVDRHKIWMNDTHWIFVGLFWLVPLAGQWMNGRALARHGVGFNRNFAQRETPNGTVNGLHFQDRQTERSHSLFHSIRAAFGGPKASSARKELTLSKFDDWCNRHYETPVYSRDYAREVTNMLYQYADTSHYSYCSETGAVHAPKSLPKKQRQDTLLARLDKISEEIDENKNLKKDYLLLGIQEPGTNKMDWVTFKDDTLLDASRFIIDSRLGYQPQKPYTEYLRDKINDDEVANFTIICPYG